MRRLILTRPILAGLALVAAVTVFEIPSAQAQVSNGRNPWCIRDGALGAGSWDCMYYTFEQCRLSAEGAGGSCSRNPEYRGGRQSNNPRRGNRGNAWDGGGGAYGGTWGYGGGWGPGGGRW
jgi:hypothetical protein